MNTRSRGNGYTRNNSLLDNGSLKYISATTNRHAKIDKLFEVVIWIRFVPSGGGVEYLHRDPASRRRRRKGKSQI
jgi:hypothetical protein